MQYRRLGGTGLQVSEIGVGCEWFEHKSPEEVAAIMDAARAQGMNVLDCWVSDPRVRSMMGDAIASDRGRWIIQGHIGSTWQDGQYVRTREVEPVKRAFEDLLARTRPRSSHASSMTAPTCASSRSSRPRARSATSASPRTTP